MRRLALAVCIALACAAPAVASDRVERMRHVMGTLWTIEAEGDRAGEAVETAFAEIRRLDALLSTYRPDSELSRLNRTAAAAPVALSDETASLIRRALAYAAASDGAFDPTVGPLVKAWGFKHLDYKRPSEAQLAAARARVGYRHVRFDRGRLAFARPGMELDLGAIAKGYAVDRALSLLGARGMRRARVDAGGNQAVLGAGPWRFGVRHPRREGELLGVVTLAAGGLSTSGDAERGFWLDGRRYGHVLDARTGWPASAMSVTVTAPTAEAADALSTALAVLGPAKGRALLARYPGCEALFVLPDGKGHRLEHTPGLSWTPAP